MCAFCQLHEADFLPEGVEGFGTATVEHFVLQSQVAALRNEYVNCYYSCRLCNSARSTRPVSWRGARLLAPDADAWAEHFELEGDKLIPVVGDRDAEYTADVYDINDERKVVRREQRRSSIEEALQVLAAAGEDLRLLEERIQQETDLVELRKLAQLAGDFRRIYTYTMRQLRRHLPVPRDAPPSCACSNREELALPQDLMTLLVEVGLEGLSSLE